MVTQEQLRAAILATQARWDVTFAPEPGVRVTVHAVPANSRELAERSARKQLADMPRYLGPLVSVTQAQ